MKQESYPCHGGSLGWATLGWDSQSKEWNWLHGQSSRLKILPRTQAFLRPFLRSMRRTMEGRFSLPSLNFWRTCLKILEWRTIKDSSTVPRFASKRKACHENQHRKSLTEPTATRCLQYLWSLRSKTSAISVSNSRVGDFLNLACFPQTKNTSARNFLSHHRPSIPKSSGTVSGGVPGRLVPEE